MRHVPPGGNWRDLPPEIRDEAMGGATRGGRTGFYRRLDPGTPAPTIVASPAQRSTLLWHPHENRPISPEEAAVLQSYPTHIEKAPRRGIRALDLFAGTGWGVACQRLGIDEYGVENMPEAVAVRAANGMRTTYHDVWDGLLGDDVPRLDYELLIASPPCQTFSMAGSGAGRKALDDVLAAIDRRDYLDPQRLHDLGDELDPRTALVLTPLAHVARDTPMYVVLEQVPPVLPVWERMAEEMRRWGYSVWTGNLQAEMYGVPQTRKRAILIARADGKEAKPPTPTHSRYYPRDPKRLDEGVLPWVSMAEALGWPEGEFLVGNQVPPGNARNEYHSRSAAAPAQSMTSNAGSMQRSPDGARVMRSNYGTGGDAQNRGEREGDEPAPTMTSKADRNLWTKERPATTLAADDRIAGPGRSEFVKGGTSRQDRPGSTRVTLEEAAALQSYPADFTWDATFIDSRGRERPVTKTNKFLQVGNAVPPLLAEAILREVLS